MHAAAFTATINIAIATTVSMALPAAVCLAIATAISLALSAAISIPITAAFFIALPAAIGIPIAATFASAAHGVHGLNINKKPHLTPALEKSPPSSALQRVCKEGGGFLRAVRGHASHGPSRHPRVICADERATCGQESPARRRVPPTDPCPPRWAHHAGALMSGKPPSLPRLLLSLHRARFDRSFRRQRQAFHSVRALSSRRSGCSSPPLALRAVLRGRPQASKLVFASSPASTAMSRRARRCTMPRPNRPDSPMSARPT